MCVEEIKKLEEEIAELHKTLENKKIRLNQLRNSIKKKDNPYSKDLSTEEVVRYSRQMIMPQVAHTGQISLKRSKVLIVGAGGLGCPSAIYLAAAGVGEIHIIDYDDVDLSNLHRQILHYEADIGISKVKSVCNKLQCINSDITVVPHHLHASSSITKIIQENNYNVVLDCSDNAPTRYLLNDVCVLNNIPLVSGSALQMEGQLTVYNYQNGPCYRCLFPVPPPPHTVTNCGDGGVLGVVAGTIGILQALETIKIITKMDGVLSGRLLLFDGSISAFRNIKLRPKMENCAVCSVSATIIAPIDYEQFCGSRAHDKITDIDVLHPEENIDVEELKNLLNENNVIIDVRSKLEYAMCKLSNTINLPYPDITTVKGLSILQTILEEHSRNNVYILCRRGNDSQRTVKFLKEHFDWQTINFKNVKGGLYAYSRLVDSTFPVY